MKQNPKKPKLGLQLDSGFDDKNEEIKEIFEERKVAKQKSSKGKKSDQPNPPYALIEGPEPS